MARFFGRLRIAGTFAAVFPICAIVHAQQPPARFDLSGPKVEIHVTRAGKTLPIASVPNLQPGDKVWLHPDLPPSQSVHYLLVAAFLRGTTNPPPENWFYKIQTWDKKVRAEGVTITVPQEAQQALLFLAPETGGDFSTLRSAVRGRPGIFVRASQDLAEAGFEQARIEKYLASMRQVPPSDAKALLDHSNLLARTLNLKPNQDCFNRAVDMQFNCLTQSGNQTLLDDGHSQTIVATLTNGPNSDLINAASYTGLAGGGMYSAYVGAVVDLVRVMSGLHTAHYQYIPAIAFPDRESLNLRLNTPPSFNNPKSVIVIGLPAVQASVPPPLRPTDPKFVSCLLKPSLVLPVEGAPLVFSTGFTHDLVLHLNDSASGSDIPLTADAFQGGLVLAHASSRKVLPLGSDGAPSITPPAVAADTPEPPAKDQNAPSTGTVTTGTISGFWGFDAFTGPTLLLQDVPGKGWKLASGDVLIAGRENNLSLTSTGAACVQSVALQSSTGKQLETQWKPGDKPNLIMLRVPLQNFDPGALHFAIHQYGEPQADLVAAQTFSEPARLISLQLHAGDTIATLAGTSLDQVQQASLGGLIFTPVLPAADSIPDGSNSTLRLALPANISAPSLRPGDKLTASFTLKDGRNLTLPVTIAAPRPSINLLSKNVSQSGNSSIRLTNQDDLPANQQLTFSLRSNAPFPRSGQIEVSNADESLHTTLSVSSGNLVLQNPHTLLATLDPLKAFGTSAYGPLRIRAVSSDGASDWLPLVTLVRLPELKDLHCPTDASSPCTLTGSNLYLVDSLANNPDFTDATTVPEGFVGTTLSLSRPPKSGFYLRLRDDPATSNTVTMPILPLQTATIEHKETQP